MRSPACSRMSTERLIERRVLARVFGEVGTANHEERSDVVVCKSMATQPGPVIDPGGWARDNETRRKRTTNMMNRVKRYPVLSPSSRRQLPAHFYVPSNLRSARKGGGRCGKFTLGYICGVLTCYKPRVFSAIFVHVRMWCFRRVCASQLWIECF
jgi:hypothetical protein